jgi:TonB family protein
MRVLAMILHTVFFPSMEISLPSAQTRRSSTAFFLLVLVASAIAIGSHPTRGFAEDRPERKVRVRVSPVYPDIARKMRLNGVVRVQVVISPNGNVKETKVIGGHPILVTAAVDAVKKWKFDSASAETTGTLEIKFDPGN